MNPNNPPTPAPPVPNQPTNQTLQTLIPTQNKPALIGYYFGVFGLIPFLGLPLAIVAIVLGAKGLKQFKLNPTPGAKGHAITAIVLGIVQIVCFIAFILFVVLSSKS